MNQEQPRKTPIQDEMRKLETEGAFEKPRREEKPIGTPIQDQMRRIEEEKELRRQALFPEQAKTADLDDEGNVVVPDTGSRMYIDPKDGQIHEQTAGKRLPPHSRAA